VSHLVRALVVGVLVLASACRASSTAGEQRPSAEPTARIVFLGDVMLGRAVAAVVANDPSSVFEGLRPAVAGADLVLANLESPLTTRPHLVGEHALETDPATARLLAGAGIDVVGLANNHVGDAGPGTVEDTMTALAGAGVLVAGAGSTISDAWRPLVVDAGGVRIAVLAIDGTRGGPEPGAMAGVAVWETDRVEAAITLARQQADVVVVGLHGGVEYLPRPDPVLRATVEQLTAWGADVVWGHGTHVPYPVDSVSGLEGRPSLQAPGLGNALFDQRYPGTDEGLVLEVLVGADGVIAHRTGRVATRLRSTFLGWDEPAGDVVALHGGWWQLDRGIEPAAMPPTDEVPGLFAEATPVAAAIGDATGDGVDEVVASYRRPYRPRLLHDVFSEVTFQDPAGRTAHLGLFDPVDGRLIWGAGTMLRPAERVAVCDGSLALGWSALDTPGVIGGGAWTWASFGFSTLPDLDGPATPGCADVDRDGLLDPVLIGRGDAVS
jgi:poly-gamma-glutamate capsule biosynthesis protein CapA/YwtB (metallophosphatase superfamily)